MILKNCHSDSLYKKLNKFNDEIISLKNVVSRKEEKKELKNYYPMLKIFRINCITFTKTNTSKK